MKKFKVILVLAFISIFFSACGIIDENNTIEYGEIFDQNKFLDLNEGEEFEVPLSVDTKTIGAYVFKGNVKKEGQVVRTLDKDVIVNDTEKPTISTVQSTNTIFEIPFKDQFQVLGNIDQIADKVDGEYNEIQIVTEDMYKDLVQQITTAKLESMKSKFTKNEEVEAYNSSKLKSGYSILTTDLNTSKAGTYVIKVACFDKGYNITELSYKLAVLEEGSEVSSEKLAAGASGSVLGKGADYQVINQVQSEVVEKKEEPLEVPNTTPIEPDKIDDVKNFQENTVPNNTISAQGSPVLQAALNLVGGHMACDSTVTMALVNGGMISGNPNEIFVDGNIYNIGVYQFPQIATFINAAQAIPGDLIYYDNGGMGSAHIAVYAGNGKAVHGGWNGSDIVISTVNVGSGPRYMRFDRMSWDDIYKKIFGEKPGLSFNPTDPSISSNPTLPENNNRQYNFMSTVGEIRIAITSSSPIDSDYAHDQIVAYANEEQTYDQMVANFAQKGYSIIEPFDMP